MSNVYDDTYNQFLSLKADVIREKPNKYSAPKPKQQAEKIFPTLKMRTMSGNQNIQRIGGSFNIGDRTSLNFKANGSIPNQKIFGGGLGFTHTF